MFPEKEKISLEMKLRVLRHFEINYFDTRSLFSESYGSEKHDKVVRL